VKEYKGEILVTYTTVSEVQACNGIYININSCRNESKSKQRMTTQQTGSETYVFAAFAHEDGSSICHQSHWHQEAHR